MAHAIDYTLTCSQVIDNLLMLADAYEKASAGKAPSGFAFNPADAAATMKAAVYFIGSFGQQLTAAQAGCRWLSVHDAGTPESSDTVWGYDGEGVFLCEWYKSSNRDPRTAADGSFESYGASCDREGLNSETLTNVTHWAALAVPPAPVACPGKPEPPPNMKTFP